MSKIIISVIIPAYNVDKYIEECLDSVIKQTYKNLEIIIINDGSSDNTLSICKRYESSDDRITVISQPNAGVSAARNAGIKIMTGEYALFLDSDDHISSDYCEKALRKALECDADVVVGEIICVDQNGNHISSQEGLSIEKEIILDNREAVIAVIKEEGIKGFVWGKLFRTEVLKKYDFPEGRVYEDRAIIPKYFSCVNKVCLLPGIYSYYRMTPNSITHSSLNLEKWNDLIRADEELIRFIKDNYPEYIDDMISVYFGRFVHIWIYMYDFGSKEQMSGLINKMKQVYREYSATSKIQKKHKYSYQLIFRFPYLYRKLIRMAGWDKKEQDAAEVI